MIKPDVTVRPVVLVRAAFGLTVRHEDDVPLDVAAGRRRGIARAVHASRADEACTPEQADVVVSVLERA